MNKRVFCTMFDVQGVTGSSPVSSTNKKPRNFNSYGVFQHHFSWLSYARFCSCSGQNAEHSGQIPGQKKRGPPYQGRGPPPPLYIQTKIYKGDMK